MGFRNIQEKFEKSIVEINIKYISLGNSTSFLNWSCCLSWVNWIRNSSLGLLNKHSFFLGSQRFKKYSEGFFLFSYFHFNLLIIFRKSVLLIILFKKMERFLWTAVLSCTILFTFCKKMAFWKLLTCNVSYWTICHCFFGQLLSGEIGSEINWPDRKWKKGFNPLLGSPPPIFLIHSFLLFSFSSLLWCRQIKSSK